MQIDQLKIVLKAVGVEDIMPKMLTDNVLYNRIRHYIYQACLRREANEAERFLWTLERLETIKHLPQVKSQLKDQVRGTILEVYKKLGYG